MTSANPKTTNIPRATIKRLATYVQVLENLARDNIEMVSSIPLANACGVQASQVRKDLGYLGEFGIRGVGYQVKDLIHSITSSLGVDHEWPLVLIGVGNLGKAILNHLAFNNRGFVIKAIFDCDPFKIGEKIHGFEVHSTEEIKSMVENLSITMGIITTPPERAQRACDNLIKAGITSIVNFAPAQIKVPKNVQVEYVDVYKYLYSLAFKQTQQWRQLNS
ncbi:MAG: redox-sensing transcriptional repressor Rex [Desulfovibrionaceae bacterium]|nr:redox-sensing transcriptional repressor Rex [Desulfovibrionaceae bacterium]